ncbi:MAG: hypothetical protein GWO07_05920 [Candidatus Dadabacteria bacterium]|nr:hypothetical protein [Candidatus Dadabacteria bacterium]NIS08292.1 hypothetical protein [Candidatus Dadabacteria bacterium]NIV12157.1 hypothetical protein [Fodinibius sp.]NIY21811.1 hypothetical protein [Candidatus Dadabacteria bacterium]
MHQQRQFNLTSQGIDVNQTGRAALDIIAATIRNAGARQGKNVTMEFINGGSEFDPLCSDITSKTGQDSPPDCLTLYTWNITAGFQNDEIKSTAQAADAIIVNSDLSVNASNWLTPIADSDLIQSSDLIGFLSKTSLCNKADQTICLNNPQDCTECGAILKIDSLDTSTKFANVSSER